MAAAKKVTQTQYEILSDFRHALRRFLAFSEDVLQSVGLTPVQHQALLSIKAFRGPISVGDLAKRLIIRHHSAVGLVDRLIEQGLVRRAGDSSDRRRVNLTLTPRGEALLARLAAVHRDELRRIGPDIEAVLVRLRTEPERNGRPATRRRIF
jgi:DNA-binding MarR family transcriptional regulator